jgi:hypothetical protein
MLEPLKFLKPFAKVFLHSGAKREPKVDGRLGGFELVKSFACEIHLFDQSWLHSINTSPRKEGSESTAANLVLI